MLYLNNDKTLLMPGEAPAVKNILCQSHGIPSLWVMKSATCLRITSMPAESVYEPTELPWQPPKTARARALTSSG